MATEQLKPWAYKPQERSAALEYGLTQYFTGRPCKHGHIAMRSSSSGTCIECAKKHQKQNLKKRLSQNPDWYKNNYAKNPEKHKQKAAAYREKNPEKTRQSYLASMRKRKPQKAAAERARQAAKLHATPHWLTQSDWERMDATYIAAQQTSMLAGFNCHVDHIVPLKGKNVCGLHVPWNLRVVSQSYNSKKKNNLDESVFFGPSQQGGVLVHESALPWNWRK
jgi:hypothetical protein